MAADGVECMAAVGRAPGIRILFPNLPDACQSATTRGRLLILLVKEPRRFVIGKGGGTADENVPAWVRNLSGAPTPMWRQRLIDPATGAAIYGPLAGCNSGW